MKEEPRGEVKEIKLNLEGLADAKEFDFGNLIPSMISCISSGYRPAFAPEIAKARISASREDRVLWEWYSTASMKARGMRNGREIDVYAHVPNYLSDPDHIRNSIKYLENGEVPISRIKPIGRIGGDLYCRLTDTFEMKRPD